MVGGLGAFLIMGITGCEQKSSQNQNNAFEEAVQKQGAFVVIQEVSPGSYKIVEEYPSSQTRVILRDINGSERILSKEELDRLVKEEAKKIENNQSSLTNPQIHSQMSLGEIILASAAGAIIGSWLGSKLFKNPTYQQQRQKSYSSPSVYQRSVESFKKRKTASFNKSSSTKSGFFSKTGQSSKSSFSFGG